MNRRIRLSSAKVEVEAELGNNILEVIFAKLKYHMLRHDSSQNLSFN